MEMGTGTVEHSKPEQKRRYKWPWFVLGFFLLGILLAVLWMSKEVEKTRRNRDLSAPAGLR